MNSKESTPYGGILLLAEQRLPKGWELDLLGNRCTIRRGASPRPAGDPRYFGGDIPWIKIGDATRTGGRYISQTEEFVNEEGAKRSLKIPAGSLLIANSGVSLGFAAITQMEGCIHDGWLVATNFDRLDRDYLYYCINHVTRRIRQLADGTTQPNLNTDIARRLLLPFPRVTEQQSIAGLLGTLDDKIDLNRRMNQTLEAIARTIFKSWFVNFDPSREENPLFSPLRKGSSRSEIPGDWRWKTLGDVIEIHDAKRVPLSARERQTRKGMFPYYGAASVVDCVDDYLFDGIYVLMGEDGSVVNEDDTPVVQYVWGKFWVNNHAHVLTGKDGISTEHILLHLQDINVRPFVTGAVQPKLNQQNLCRIPFLCPTRRVAEAFSSTVSPFFAKMRANTEESRTLAALRDTLLPKLLSGEIRVKQAEKIVGEAT